MLSVFLLFASTSVLSARRSVEKQHAQHASVDLASEGDPKKKCTISWESKGVAATVSFPVKGCRLGCLSTSKNRYDRMYAPFFVMEEGPGGKFCHCKQRGNITAQRRIAFKLIGKCENDGGKSCFNRYTDIRTETYKALGESAITRVKALGDKHERTFNYNCDDGSTWNLGDATEVYLPTILEGRDEEELEAFKRVAKKFGKKGRGGLTNEEKDLLDALGTDDFNKVAEKLEEDDPDSSPDDGTIKQQIKYQEIADGEELTVQKLREKYGELLKDTGISVQHLMNVGDLGDKADDTVVTPGMFKKFLEPEC